MTKYSLIINPFAEKDIKDSKTWYNLQKESLGKELQQEIKETVLRIKENPLQFPKIRTQIRKAFVNKFPYTILYTINNQKKTYLLFFIQAEILIFGKNDIYDKPKPSHSHHIRN